MVDDDRLRSLPGHGGHDAYPGRGRGRRSLRCDLEVGVLLDHADLQGRTGRDGGEIGTRSEGVRHAHRRENVIELVVGADGEHGHRDLDGRGRHRGHELGQAGRVERVDELGK